jgi:hypothetical protein
MAVIAARVVPPEAVIASFVHLAIDHAIELVRGDFLAQAERDAPHDASWGGGWQ